MIWPTSAAGAVGQVQGAEAAGSNNAAVREARRAQCIVRDRGRLAAPTNAQKRWRRKERNRCAHIS
eukprot:5189863-Pleurochrysis_carterae.AAC.5